MKKKKSILGVSILLLMIFAFPLDSLGQGKGKGGPPSWAPAHGYRAQTKHIYFPDGNFYFDLEKEVYIYLSGDNWKVDVNLPAIFAGIDLNSSLRIELDLQTDTPQRYNAEHLVKYKGKSSKSQVKSKSKNKGKSKNQGKGK